jgi:DNA invertase Pin-like site-specific DNA recombinase
MTRSPSGHRCGASHQKAILPDSEVVRMREMYFPYVMGYNKLAKLFKCGSSTVRDIVQFKTRINAR